MPPERIADTYNRAVTEASKSVLLEVMTILGSYRDALVLVGGWVPYFLLEENRHPDDPFDHVGSIDKDAYDIYSVVAHHRGGPKEVAATVKPFLKEQLVSEALISIRKAFESREANGPTWIVNFLQPHSTSEEQRMLTDSYMTVHEFLQHLDEMF